MGAREPSTLIGAREARQCLSGAPLDVDPSRGKVQRMLAWQLQAGSGGKRSSQKKLHRGPPWLWRRRAKLSALCLDHHLWVDS